PILVLPSNALWPVISSYKTRPKAKRSLRASASRPSICSGVGRHLLGRFRFVVHFGRAEVENLDARLACQDVVEIAMRHPFAMRGIQRVQICLARSSASFTGTGPLRAAHQQ